MSDRRRKSRTLLSLLPKAIRHPVIRNKLVIDYDTIPKGLIIKVADTQEELSEAYRILYEAYLEYGYQEANPTQMRIVKYFALPTSTTIVAKVDGRVIGTTTFIRKSAMGLPMEREFDLTHVVPGGASVAEISSLAIDSAYRHKRGTIFFPLCAYLFQYVKRYLSVDYAAIAVNPAWSDFYEGVLLFSKLHRRVVGRYDFANGAPAVGMIVATSDWSERFAAAYGDKPLSQNVHALLHKTDLPCMEWPERIYRKAMDPVLTPEMLHHFFVKNSSVLEELNDLDLQVLRNFYSDPSYDSIFQRQVAGFRDNIRYTVNLRAMTEKSEVTRVHDVSSVGVRIHSFVPERETFSLRVHVADRMYSSLKVKVIWTNPQDRSAGLQILESDSTWRDYLLYLHRDLQRKAVA